MENHKGNASEYSSEHIKQMDNSPLLNQKVLFLGSSVTYGECSLQDGIPEYFGRRFGCSFTKEAVSGTTLVDTDETSYVSRLLNNVDTSDQYDLFICQLSTNDATQGKPFGSLSASRKMADYDKSTIIGAIEYIIAYVMDTWKCKVMFYTGSRYDSKAYEQMVRVLYEIAEKWKIDVIDLWSDDSFNDISDENRSIYMNDPIHPTKAGYMQWWCPEMEKQVLGFVSIENILKNTTEENQDKINWTKAWSGRYPVLKQ